MDIVKESKDYLVSNGGYDLIVIEDFFDCFFNAIEKLEGLAKEHEEVNDGSSYPDYVHKHLMSVLCNHEEANYIIMYARFLAATYLKKNAILFEDFLGGDIAGFCLREVEQVDVECDHPQIIAITNYLEQGVEINAIAANKDRIDLTLIPEDNFPKNDFRVKVLFQPGHYDALYQ